jgi:hypothetical protein
METQTDEITLSIFSPRRIKPELSTALLSWRSVQPAALGGYFLRPETRPETHQRCAWQLAQSDPPQS